MAYAQEDADRSAVELIAATRNVIMFMSMCASRSRSAATAHAEPGIAVAAVSLDEQARSELVAAVSVMPGWWNVETAAWLPGRGLDRVTAGHLAASAALPDGAVAARPPRVFDPGSWLPRPSLELNLAASTTDGVTAVDAWSSAGGIAEAETLRISRCARLELSVVDATQELSSRAKCDVE
jgi:hypothetical protein